jgi:hypothetical protein
MKPHTQWGDSFSKESAPPQEMNPTQSEIFEPTEDPRSLSTLLAAKERFLWIALSLGLFLFSLIGWLGVPSSKRPSPKQESAPPPRASAPATGERFLLSIRLPKPLPSPRWRLYLNILQELFQLQRDLRFVWLLPQADREALDRLLEEESLSITAILAWSQNPPTPAQEQRLIAHLQKALITGLTLLAPRYQQELDQMMTPPSLPKASPALKLSLDGWRALRKETLQRFLQLIQSLQWKLWQFELLAEQILEFPYPPKTQSFDQPWAPKDKKALQRTTMRLKQAIAYLTQEEAKHPLLPVLQNRLHIQETWQKTPPKPPKPPVDPNPPEDNFD